MRRGASRLRAAAMRGRVLVAVWVAVSLGAAPTLAAKPADLARRAAAIAAERKRLASSGRLNTDSELRLIEGLGPLVLAFIDESDKAGRSARRHEAPLRRVFESIYEPLNGIYDGRNRRMERLARDVMDVDGDLEALYETREWKESQTVAAQALYYLNWLDYYGARLAEGKRRQALLEAAERGFSQFAVGGAKKDLLTESLLGRALCHLELKHYEWAVRDFKTVLDEPRVSAERKAKARLGLLEARVRGRQFAEALRYSTDLLQSGRLRSGDANVVRFYRLEALFAAAKKSKGAKAEGYSRETGPLMRRLRRAGSGWARKVDALMLSRIDDPTKWIKKADTPLSRWQVARMLIAQGKDLEAVPLLEALLRDRGSGAARYRAEASYLLGVTRLKSGEYAQAADLFDRALGSGGHAAYAAEALYLRFKALEGLMAEQPEADLAQRYEQAMRGFLEQAPGHASAYEARFRLGELLQSRGEFADAVKEYEQVAGDPGFELRASFATLQAEFELLRSARNLSEREAAAARVGHELGRFQERLAAVKGSKDRADVPLEKMEATAAIFAAVYHSLRSGEGAEKVDAVLKDFARRFPDQTDLLPQALRLRLGALESLGRFTEAEALAKRNAERVAAGVAPERVEILARGFSRAAARRRRAGDDAGAAAALRTAAILLEAVPAKKTAIRLSLGHLYLESGQVGKAKEVYAAMIESKPDSLPALRGLARVAEAGGDLPGARQAWKRYAAAVRPGDRPWYEGRYEQARITLTGGDREATCEILRQLRPAMAGLADAELRGKLDALWKQADC